MDIQEKQARWRNERPLFEAEFIHSHFLPFFNFNENTGDYEIKSEYVEDEDAKTAYEAINTGWVMWLRAKRDSKASAVPDGYVVVPKEPTEAMLRNGKRASIQPNFGRIDVPSIYKAMIEAEQELFYATSNKN